MVVFGDSWLQLILAGALSLIIAQLGFLGHEACHRQRSSTTCFSACRVPTCFALR